MPDQLALEYADFAKNHLPELYQFIVAIAHEDDEGNESIGSGVLVNLNGRHFVATAKHCIEHDPRVIHRHFFMLENKIGRAHV